VDSESLSFSRSSITATISTLLLRQYCQSQYRWPSDPMYAASLESATGRITLQERSGVSVLAPRMTLHQFAQTPVASRRFRRGFEKQHSSYNGYLIGTWDVDGTSFNLALGFTSPSSLCPPQDCSLESVSLHPCSAAARPGFYRRILLGCGLVQTPHLTESESAAICRRWLQEFLGQTADMSCYEPWGSIRFVPDHPHHGTLIEIVFSN
jgi:hypothetical protein